MRSDWMSISGDRLSGSHRIPMRSRNLRTSSEVAAALRR
jgi:hypothetical protein